MSFILKNIVTNKKINFWNFINFFKVGIGEGVVFYYIICSILYLLKEKVANPHPLKKCSQNKIKFKKNFGKFLIFGGGGGGQGGGRGNFIYSKNSFKT